MQTCKREKLATYIQASNSVSACIYMKSIWAEAVDPWAAMNSVAGRSVVYVGATVRDMYMYITTSIPDLG